MASRTTGPPESPARTQSRPTLVLRAGAEAAWSGESRRTSTPDIGTASATLIQNLLVISTSSGLVSSAPSSRGSRAMPQIGQLPGSDRMICGCIGHVYSVRVVDALMTAGSSAMPHLGQLPGPICLTSGSMGHVYSAGCRFFVGRYAGMSAGLDRKYLSGSARNFVAQPWLQKHKAAP